jgi:DNA-binding NtrC family response regulator
MSPEEKKGLFCWFRPLAKIVSAPLSPSLLFKLLWVFLLLSAIPLFSMGILVEREIWGIQDLSEKTSHFVENQAAEIARSVSALLYETEGDLRELASLPRNDAAYAAFVKRHQRMVWLPTGNDTKPSGEKTRIPLYREVAFVDAAGLEQVVVIRGQSLSAQQHRNVSDPQQTTYRSETYFAEAMNLHAAEIYVSRLTGFHVNKIEQLGIEKWIGGLKDKSSRQKQIYRYLLYQWLQSAGEVEFVGSFQEDGRTVLVYRQQGDNDRLLVEVPADILAEEERAMELELRAFLKQLNPEDVPAEVTYDGMIRFATPVDSTDGKREGIVVIGLDALHLLQLTQHIKAMEFDSTVFAGYRDADYTFLFDDEGWVITHPKLWNIRGVDKAGRLLDAYSEKSKLVEVLVGRWPVNLLHLDWKLGEGYGRIVEETLLGHTGFVTRPNLAGVLCTRVYSPIFYDTGPYAKKGVFGGVMMGTRADKFVELMGQLNERISSQMPRVQRHFLWLLLGLFVLSCLLSVWLARSFIRPIRALGKAAQQIGGGQIDTPIPDLGKDEIGELGQSFRGMTSNLKERIEELKQKNVEIKEAQKKLLAAEHEKSLVLQQEVKELQKEIERASFASLIAESPPMKKIQEEIVQIAGSAATVLILGENGTGKEIIAEAIHRNSTRKDKHFLKINCAAFNENLLESELFGHVKGSFTGASSNRKGLFEAADGGTLLLDEIGDMSLSMQTKLLRTIQEGEVVPVGSSQVVKTNVRLLAATNKDIQQLMKEGRFREDLFHRLNVMTLRVPPVRERKEDILPLVTHFIRKICERENKPPISVDAKAEQMLVQYSWPGNVREIENSVERAVIRSRGQVLHGDDFQLQEEKKSAVLTPEGATRPMTLEEVEKDHILGVLEKNKGNKKVTAEELAIGYNTLWRKLKQYNKL